MEYSLLIIFYYGMLHALGPDHLSAIALFSIGKKKKEALMLSLLFAIGHGVTLYLLALLIQYSVDPSWLKYGDIISSIVILVMGIYLIYLAASSQIRVNKHQHNDDKHTHIYYKNAHLHDKSMLVSLGLLMGAGGIRGMLITLGIIANQQVGVEMILAFVLGVSMVFLLFGYLIYLINKRLIFTNAALRYALISVGFLSIAIGVNNLSESLMII